MNLTTWLNEQGRLVRVAVNRRTGKKDTTVAWGTRRNIVKRKDRTVEI